MTGDRPIRSLEAAEGPRVRAPDRQAVPPATQELLDMVTQPDGTMIATVAVLAHHPSLLGPFLGWAAALALEGALPLRDHELLALRTAARCESSFEWDEHVSYARRAGFSNEEIASVAALDVQGPWSPTEAALLRAADELVASRSIEASTWAELTDAYDDAALAEIPFVVGQYTMLSMVANSLHL